MTPDAADDCTIEANSNKPVTVDGLDLPEVIDNPDSLEIFVNSKSLVVVEYLK